jgi:hypothetical protein
MRVFSLNQSPVWVNSRIVVAAASSRTAPSRRNLVKPAGSVGAVGDWLNSASTTSVVGLKIRKTCQVWPLASAAALSRPPLLFPGRPDRIEALGERGGQRRASRCWCCRGRGRRRW